MNFTTYKNLLKYSLVENKKTYISAFGIGILAYIVCSLFFGHIINHGFGMVDYDGMKISNAAVMGSAIVGTGFFAFAMLFVVTQAELANRYCVARKGALYNMIPASHVEKGWAIITMTLVVNIFGGILFYFIAYCLSSLYYIICNATVDFSPFYFFTNMNFHFGPHSGIDYADAAKFTAILALIMIPVSSFANHMLYYNLVTYFRSKAQLKGLASYIIIQFLFVLLLIFIGTTIDNNVNIQDWLNKNVTPIDALHFVDAILLSLIPITAGFIYWFMRRLHYKEIR